MAAVSKLIDSMERIVGLDIVQWANCEAAGAQLLGVVMGIVNKPGEV